MATVFHDLFEAGVFVNPVIPPAVTGEARASSGSASWSTTTRRCSSEAAETLYKVIAAHDQL